MSKHTKDLMGNDTYYRSTSSHGIQTWVHYNQRTGEELIMLHEPDGEVISAPCNVQTKRLTSRELHMYSIGAVKTSSEVLHAIRGMNIRMELILAIKRYEFERADKIACFHASSLLELFKRLDGIDILPRFKKRAMELLEVKQ